jgi:hypothetical protein
MKSTKVTAVAALLTVLGLIAVRAQEQPTVTLSVAEIARLAQSRNLEIFKAALSVKRAREDLVGEPTLVDSELSVGSGLSIDKSGLDFPGIGSSLSLPITPQLSVGGGVAVAPEDGGVALDINPVQLTVKPLEPSRQTYKEEEALESAVVEERYLKHNTYLDGEKAALNLLARDMERELARASEELEQKKYELAQHRLELGEASFQDVQDGLVDLLQAREDLYDREQKYLGDWKTLQLLFAPSEERVAVAPLSIEELSELVQTRRQETELYVEAVPTTEKLQTLRLELVALQEELKKTPGWRPDLDITATVATPSFHFSSSGESLSFVPGLGLGVSLGFSPNQFKRDDREDLEADIEVKRMEIAVETYSAKLQKSLELQNITLDEQALESARIQAERDAVALQEAELLFEQGRRTSLELEQLRLNLDRDRIQIFQAAAELYDVLGVYLTLFVAD